MEEQKYAAALLEATAAGDAPRVRFILQESGSPAVVNYKDSHGWTPLLAAVEARHVELVQLLLASGADVNLTTAEDGMNALHLLAEQGKRDFSASDTDEAEGRKAASQLFDILLEAGVDPNARNSSGETVLHLACMRGNIDLARLLLDRKLVKDIDAANIHGDTALHYASRKGHRRIVDLLIEQGASSAVESRFGTPSQVAGEFHQDDIAQLLRSLSQDQVVGPWSLPPEVMAHVLSFLGEPTYLCSVAKVCRAFAAISRDDSLWKPLGHPSWLGSHVKGEEGGEWKVAYMTWLRAAIKQYRTKKRNVPHVSTEQSHQPTPNYDYLANGVGKSSLLKRYVDNSFSAAAYTTIGMEFMSRLVQHRGETVKLQLWDLAGPERFRAVPVIYYRGAHAVILVYDVSNRRSFTDGAVQWMTQIRECVAQNVCVVLVGHKTDLRSRAVAEEEGRKKAEEWGVAFCECSAKTGKGVDDVFMTAVEHMMGGWSAVNGMATPRHVPSEDDLAAKLLTPTTGGKEQPLSRCSLQ